VDTHDIVVAQITHT